MSPAAVDEDRSRYHECLRALKGVNYYSSDAEKNDFFKRLATSEQWLTPNQRLTLSGLAHDRVLTPPRRMAVRLDMAGIGVGMRMTKGAPANDDGSPAQGGVAVNFARRTVEPSSPDVVIIEARRPPPPLPPGVIPAPPPPPPPPPAPGSLSVKLTPASEITPRAIGWIFDQWVARGKLHILAGNKGDGKTTIAMAFCACASTGSDVAGIKNVVGAGSVLIWSGEDDPIDVLVPRLIVAGANRDKIHFIGAVSDSTGKAMPFDPSVHMDALIKTADRLLDLRLIIIDPIVSAVSGDTNNNGAVRRGLQPLIDLAVLKHAAVIGIHHVSKGTQGKAPVERVTGSLAFGAAARVVLMTSTPKPNEDGTPRPRILTRAASNLSASGGGFEYTLRQMTVVVAQNEEVIPAQAVEWGDVIEGDAAALMNDADGPQDGKAPKADGAMEFIRQALEFGEADSALVRKEAKAAGISDITFRRARAALGVVIRKQPDGKTFWKLPPQRKPG